MRIRTANALKQANSDQNADQSKRGYHGSAHDPAVRKPDGPKREQRKRGDEVPSIKTVGEGRCRYERSGHLHDETRGLAASADKRDRNNGKGT